MLNKLHKPLMGMRSSHSDIKSVSVFRPPSLVLIMGYSRYRGNV